MNKAKKSIEVVTEGLKNMYQLGYEHGYQAALIDLKWKRIEKRAKEISKKYEIQR